MSEKKPEWFEISESDTPIAPRKARAKFNARPVVALAVSGVIIGAGAIFANAEEETPANAETPAITTTVDNGTASGVTTLSNSNGSTSNNSAISAGVANPVSNSSTKSGGIANPATTQDRIANPMTNGTRGGDDDDEGEFGEHEGREHHGDKGFRPPRPGHDDDRHEEDDDD